MRLEDRIGEEAAGYCAEVARVVAEHAGPELTGVWLFGSAALGDFAPARSDLDIQAVTAKELAPDTRRSLAHALGHERLPCPARGLEFVLYSREGLADPAGPRFQLNLNSGARMDEHLALDPADDPRFWFALDAAIGRGHGVTLAGAHAREVFPAQARPAVLAALADALDWYAREEGLSAQTVLGAARALAFTADGRWRSKTEAARWAHDAVPGGDVATAALAVREGDPVPPLDPVRARALVESAQRAVSDARREGT